VQPSTVDWRWQKIIKEALHDPGRWHRNAEIAPRFRGKMAERQAQIIKEAGQVLQATLEAYEIDTRLRIAHFLGQTGHESAGFVPPRN
jgi:hypothetical protein